jgi:hypothetical protein
MEKAHLLHGMTDLIETAMTASAHQILCQPIFYINLITVLEIDVSLQLENVGMGI